MVNTFAVYKSLLFALMKLAGVRPQIVEIDPGTILNFWVPNEIHRNPEKSKHAKKQDRTKPAVVFLHGFAADGIITWQFQVLALARKYRVYVPDFLFFGGSTTDRSERSPEFQAECVAKGLEKLGVERCTLVGFSYGGTVGFKMAEMYPNLVQSMVVTCSVIALTKSISGAGLERIGFKSWSEYLLPDSIKGVKLLLELATVKLPWIPNFIYRHYFEVMFDHRKEKEELLEAMVIDDKDFNLAHHPQKVPVHLLWGENDIIFTMEGAENLRRQLGGRATVLKSIEKAGHLAHMERPFIYNKCLKDILETLLEENSEAAA
ncbi:epoxide hydrolase 4-like [Juglans microcarpa x Juglans regia]|uniref:epoxide hydrolase 4-like n=1 Tax=Juglans microcarpa x Juglans regia TaxID=2249226 RepID=UPI001B7F67AE|nr:epoxide hydrolase 4-like [Juglans microcarpa x Juglans regia]